MDMAKGLPITTHSAGPISLQVWDLGVMPGEERWLADISFNGEDVDGVTLALDEAARDREINDLLARLASATDRDMAYSIVVMWAEEPETAGRAVVQPAKGA